MRTIKFNGEVITYKDLHSRAIWNAGLLQQSGIGVEMLVGVYLDDPIAVATAYFGIAFSGGAVDLDQTSQCNLGYLLKPLHANLLKDCLCVLVAKGSYQISIVTRLTLNESLWEIIKK